MSLFGKIVAGLSEKTVWDARRIARDNPRKAISILEMLAKADKIDAMEALFFAYFAGFIGNEKVIDVDYEKADFWLEELLKRGQTQYYETRWQMYSEFDEKKALAALKVAAEKEIPNSMRYLGDCYLHGSMGLQENYQKGLEWHRRAAAKGDIWAHTALGNAYRDGKYIEKDPVKAYMWFIIASSKEKAENYERYLKALKDFNEPIGSKYYELKKPIPPDRGRAETAKDELASLLTREQIVSAQQMAETCLAVDYRGFD